MKYINVCQKEEIENLSQDSWGLLKINTIKEIYFIKPTIQWY